LIQESALIGRQVLERRLTSAHGSAAWVGPKGYGTELIPLRVVQLGPHLYDGTAGIAFFFAALERVLGDGEFRRASLDAIAPLRQKLADLVSDQERSNKLRLQLGGLMGVGSFIYSLLRIGELIEEPALFEEAHQATNLITSERIAQDPQVRLQTGCAGTILSLLALNERISKPNRNGKTPLQLASECARHLLTSRIFPGDRMAAWPLSPGKPPLAGFSYGAAGICHSLLRLYDKTRDPELWEAAQQGLAFVDSLYSVEQKKWRDARMVLQSRYSPRKGAWKDWWATGTLADLEEQTSQSDVEDRFLDMWCHGASGIALGYVGALHVNDSQEIRNLIYDTAERIWPSAGSLEVDDLCCGSFGCVELLLGIYNRLDDERALDKAHGVVKGIRDRARLRGSYRLSAARGTDAFAPSLFQGIAGVGYSLLRLAEPKSLPCLLLLE
jgi:lantibiotic modifying enzyme